MKSLRTPQHKALSSELRRLRKEQGITQTILAQRLDVPQSYVAKVEGLERRLDVVEFVKWLDALNAKDNASQILLSISDAE